MNFLDEIEANILKSFKTFLPKDFYFTYNTFNKEIYQSSYDSFLQEFLNITKLIILNLHQNEKLEQILRDEYNTRIIPIINKNEKINMIYKKIIQGKKIDFNNLYNSINKIDENIRYKCAEIYLYILAKTLNNNDELSSPKNNNDEKYIIFIYIVHLLRISQLLHNNNKETITAGVLQNIINFLQIKKIDDIINHSLEFINNNNEKSLWFLLNYGI